MIIVDDDGVMHKVISISELWNMRREVEALPKIYPYVDHIDSYCKSSEVLRIIDKHLESEDNK